MRRARPALAALLAAAALAGCAGANGIRRPAELAGQWHGRRAGPMGHAPADMTIAASGAYTGTMYLDGGDRPFRGTVSVVRPGQLRYDGSDGSGAVHLSREPGRRVLKFLRDDGGIEGVFRLVQ
jgi:hypothetical protein